MSFNIENFYNKSDYREYIRQPFQLDGKTIATNGHVMLVTPQYGDYPDCQDRFAGNARAALERINHVNAHEQFLPIPVDLKIPDKIECGTCAGLGKATKKQCKECSGEGEVEFGNGYNDYYFECKTCEGEGDIIKTGGTHCCPTCAGTGSVYPKDSRIELCGTGVDANLLALIMDEPGIELCAAKVLIDQVSGIFFRAGDTLGLIMEMRA